MPHDHIDQATYTVCEAELEDSEVEDSEAVTVTVVGELLVLVLSYPRD
jgi:hypothetical protein